MDKNTVLDILKETYNKCLEKVEDKGIYYHFDDDRLGHLRSTAVATGLTTERSIHSLMSKHFTALPSMLDNQDSFSMAQFDEYLLDILVYTGYLRCVVLESKGFVGGKPLDDRSAKVEKSNEIAAKPARKR
jgi:hypothetical protein